MSNVRCQCSHMNSRFSSFHTPSLVRRASTVVAARTVRFSRMRCVTCSVSSGTSRVHWRCNSHIRISRVRCAALCRAKRRLALTGSYALALTQSMACHQSCVLRGALTPVLREHALTQLAPSRASVRALGLLASPILSFKRKHNGGPRLLSPSKTAAPLCAAYLQR
jgi:hypothetical protein